MTDVDKIVTTALKRATIMLNRSSLGEKEVSRLLNLYDHQLCSDFKDNPELFVYNKVKRDISLKPEDAIKRYFYGELKIEQSNAGKKRIVYSPTEAFLELLDKNVDVSDPRSSSLGFPGSVGIQDILFNCATNYLMKNLWHNFYHNYFQNIHFHSYKFFKGIPRTISEFSADNMANNLLILSYGQNISCDGFPEDTSLSEMRAIFFRNRSNRLFKERSDFLEDSIPDEEKYLRNICNFVSCQLIQAGFSVGNLIPFLNEDGEVVMQANGYFIPTKILARTSSESKPYTVRESHYKEVAIATKTEYAWLLRRNEKMRREAELYLGIIFNDMYPKREGALWQKTDAASSAGSGVRRQRNGRARR